MFSEAVFAQIRDAKRIVEQASPQNLVADLERVLDGYFQFADGANRVMAILIIGVFEDALIEELMSGFHWEAILWALGIATAIAVVSWGLSKLGPL